MSRKSLKQRIERRKRFGIAAIAALVAPLAAMWFIQAISDLYTGKGHIDYNAYMLDQPVTPVTRLVGSAAALVSIGVILWRYFRRSHTNDS